MFLNLFNIMKTERVSVDDLSNILGMHRNTLYNKLNGESDFTLPEAEKIHSVFRKYDFDYLFTREDGGLQHTG